MGKLDVTRQLRIRNRETRYWQLFTDYNEESSCEVSNILVCEDCYYTSPQYKNVGKWSPAIKRYWSRKKMRQRRQKHKQKVIT